MAVGTDGRGTVVGLTDLRSRSSVETANMGVRLIHHRPSDTDFRSQFVALVAAIGGWPSGPVGKVLRVTGGAKMDD